MNNKVFTAILLLSFSLIWIGCWNEKTKPDLTISQVEEAQLQVPIERFESDLFKTNAQNLDSSFQALKQKYGSFFDIYTQKILAIPFQDSLSFKQTLLSFIQDPDMKDVTKDIQKTFPNMEETEDDLEKAFKYYKHYFPDSTLPRIITMNSGFNYAVVTTDSALVIGLDMYLGDSYQYYSLLGFPKYKTACMNKTYLSTDLVSAWSSTIFEEPLTSNTVLGKMIYQGKLLYLLDAFLPDKADELKIKYTKEQLEWCVKNEKQIWESLLNRKLLYSNKMEEMAKLVNDAPFTAGFSRESPGRIGRWVGWQIIRKYMKKHPEINFQQLMKEGDYDKIFRESNYKPI